MPQPQEPGFYWFKGKIARSTIIVVNGEVQRQQTFDEIPAPVVVQLIQWEESDYSPSGLLVYTFGNLSCCRVEDYAGRWRKIEEVSF